MPIITPDCHATLSSPMLPCFVWCVPSSALYFLRQDWTVFFFPHNFCANLAPKPLNDGGYQTIAASLSTHELVVRWDEHHVNLKGWQKLPSNPSYSYLNTFLEADRDSGWVQHRHNVVVSPPSLFTLSMATPLKQL